MVKGMAAGLGRKYFFIVFNCLTPQFLINLYTFLACFWMRWVQVGSKCVRIGRQNPINIKFEVNRNNFIKCYVNDKVEFEPAERINPRILKKAFLAAWGDGHNMRVEFDSIGFLTR